MSRTPLAIVILLVVGAIVLRQIRPGSSPTGIWLPIVAFGAGPLLALGVFAADVFIVSQNYVTTEDYVDSLIPIIAIGFIGGAIGAAGIWAGDRLRFGRKPNH